MSSSELPRFDDSEDEEEFNPAPADPSDDERERDEEDEQLRRNSEYTRQRDHDDATKNDTGGHRPISHASSSDDVDEDQQSAHNEGDDDGQERDDEGEDEEEEEDEDDDDVQQVCRAAHSGLSFALGHANELDRGIAENDAGTDVTPSSISKLRLTMKTRVKMRRKTAKRSKISSTTHTPTMSPRARA